ncbi:MAG: hypothetical protein DPW16_19535 [Chloroflexi bacterium]|nr:hypothetical protein [Chloroflexota bacterium]
MPPGLDQRQNAVSHLNSGAGRVFGNALVLPIPFALITVAAPMGATIMMVRPHNSPAHSIRASVPPSHLAGGSLHIAFGHTLPVQRLWKIAIQLVGNKVAQTVLEVKRGGQNIHQRKEGGGRDWGKTD